MALAVPHSLLTLVQAVDPVHAGEVAWLARAASDAAGLDGDLAFAAGFVHDVGKLWVPP
jgi:HD superfamily phosphohydrolase YqeK